MMAKIETKVEITHYHWFPVGDYRRVGDVSMFRLFWIIPIYKHAGAARSLFGIVWSKQ